MAWRGSGVRIPSAPLNFVAPARQFYTIENMRDTSAIGNRTAGIVLVLPRLHRLLRSLLRGHAAGLSRAGRRRPGSWCESESGCSAQQSDQGRALMRYQPGVATQLLEEVW